MNEKELSEIILSGRGMTQDRIDEKLEQMSRWKAFGENFGWRLLGWTEDFSALYEVDDYETVDITRTVRTQIEGAIKT